MRPLLDKPISIRISEEEHQTYAKAAADLGLSLSAYLRLRLISVGEEYVADQIAQLRLTLLDNLPPPGQSDTTPLLLEAVLLLRRTCKPVDMAAVRAELARLGMTPWAGPPRSTD